MKLWCFFGLHDWEYNSRFDGMLTPPRNVSDHRRCRQCGWCQKRALVGAGAWDEWPFDWVDQT